MYNLYLKNDQTLLKHITEDLNKWTGVPCSCIVVVCIVNMSVILSSTLDRVQCQSFYLEVDSKIYMEEQSPRLALIIFKSNNNMNGLALQVLRLIVKLYQLNSMVLAQGLKYSGKEYSQERHPCIYAN